MEDEKFIEHEKQDSEKDSEDHEDHEMEKFRSYLVEAKTLVLAYENN